MTKTESEMNVLHLSSEKTWRGGEQQIAYLIDELSGVGVTNHVAVRENSAFEEHCKKNKISFFSLPFRNTIDVATALSIKKYCQQARIDIVHVHSAKSHGIAVLSAVLGNKTPIVLSRRVDFVPKNNMVTRWRYNHPSIKAILGVSDVITSIMKSFVRNPSICVTVHSGIDTGRFQTQPGKNILREQYNIPEDFLLIGNTSALADHKDYHTFLNTIAELISQNLKVKAFVIGQGELESELKAKASSLGLDGVVFFTGFRKDLNEVLRSLDLFLITSKTEGLGTSVLDAFACDIPVVATKAGGIPEMVEHMVTGMLAPVGDHKTLASHAGKVFNDSVLRGNLIAGARKKLAGFSKKATAEKTLAVYRRIVAGQTIS